MRKIYNSLFKCLIILLIGIVPILTYAQDATTPDKETRKEKRQEFHHYFYLNGNIGLMFNNTDLNEPRFLAPPNTWRLGYGGSFGWQFKPVWGIRLRASGGNIYGELEDRQWLLDENGVLVDKVKFKASIFDYHGDLTINLSNAISGYNPDRKFDFYTLIGFGGAQWYSHVYDISGDETSNPNYDKEIRANVTDNMPGDSAGIGDRYMVFEYQMGLGATYHLSPKFDLNLEYELKLVDSDALDKYTRPASSNFGTSDWYSYGSLGLTYKFGQGDPLKKMEKNFNTVTFKAEPDPLEAHGGKVAVKITGTFPEGYFHPKAAMWAEPVLICDGERIPMKPILLKGTSVGGEGIVISKDGGSFTYETVIDYKDNCRAADLVIEPILFLPKEDLPADLTKEDVLGHKKNIQLPAKKIADGVIITPQKFAFNQTGAIVPHGYVKEVIISKQANIYFEVNKHNINWNVPLNKLDENKNKLTELINFVGLGYKIKDINIDGWASPEGEETFNQGLSENRTKNAHSKYVVEKIKGLIKAKDTKMTVKNAETEIKYNLLHHGPDWNGFIAALQASDIKEKSSILNVINSAGTPAKKEEEIRNMIKIYPEIEAKLLAPLRRAEIVVNCYEPRRTDEEIIALSTTKPGDLNEKELLYAASLQKDNKVKLDIYKSAISLFPNSYKGYANAGAIEIEMNDLKAAKAHLEKAASLNANSGEVHNNLGIIYGVEGDMVKAEEHFTKAGQLGTNADYNLGVINIYKGEYAKALSKFGNKTCDYNVALTYIAQKNYPPAQKQLDCAPKDAQTHYLMAILGSRTANTNMLFDNLGKAIQMNSAYKAEAQIDREFIKYFADPNFTSLVK
jgi:Flp pilus assembly protein TadD